MNYIKHLNNTFALMDQITSLKSYHISLYLVLFRMWNTSRFENPISISRKETMQLARIGSPNTYTQALRDLHKHNFIRYDPSYDKTKGSLIILYRFDTISCTPSVSKMSPSINIQTTLTIEEDEKSISHPKNKNMKKSSQNASHIENRTSLPEPVEGQHLTSQHQTSNIEHPYISDRTSPHPPLSHIQIYFHEKGHPETEAERFFNYYKSNGWLIGGKTPMKDWKAAARNWILNIKKFEQKANETRKEQFRDKHGKSKQSTSDDRSVQLRPISSPPSSSNYDEPL